MAIYRSIIKTTTIELNSSVPINDLNQNEFFKNVDYVYICHNIQI